MVDYNHKTASKQNDVKKPDQQAKIVKLSEFSDEITLKNCTINKTDEDIGYGLSFMLFFNENKITFVNESTGFGMQLAKIYEKIKFSVFDISLQSFGEGKYRGFNIVKIVKVSDVLGSIKIEGYDQ